jgi:hypothetical protein
MYMTHKQSENKFIRGLEDTQNCQERQWCQRDTVRTVFTPKREWTVGFTPKAAIWLHRRANAAPLVMIEYMVIDDSQLKIVL